MRKRGYDMKKIKIAALVCCLALLTGLFAACGNDSSLSEPGSSSAASSLTATPAPTEEPKEETKTAFFDAHIVSAELLDEYDGKTPTEGGAFLKVEISVTNTMKKEIYLFDNRLLITWLNVKEAERTADGSVQRRDGPHRRRKLEPGGKATAIPISMRSRQAVKSSPLSILRNFENKEIGEIYHTPDRADLITSNSNHVLGERGAFFLSSDKKLFDYLKFPPTEQLNTASLLFFGKIL